MGWRGGTGFGGERESTTVLSAGYGWVTYTAGGFTGVGQLPFAVLTARRLGVSLVAHFMIIGGASHSGGIPMRGDRFIRGGLAGAIAVVSIALAGAQPAAAARARKAAAPRAHLSATAAPATNVSFSNIWVGNISPGSGHAGVDIWWNGSNSSPYNPCHHSSDAYYGACIMSDSGPVSYYKIVHFAPGGNDIPFGLFIDNQDPNYCRTAPWCTNPTAQNLNHGWANLVTGAALEIYPYNAAGQYDPYTNNTGGVRVQVNDFPTFANGGRYSAQVGNIALL